MWRLRITATADADISAILDYSEETFGEAARVRYQALIRTAFADLEADPNRPAARLRDDLPRDLRTYHLLHSRDRARTEHGIVGQPRHVVVFRLELPTTIAIIRILHDSMDFRRHLPSGV